MATAPDTSSYLLVTGNSADLPYSRVLLAGTGLTLQDTGPSGGTYTIQPLGNLVTLYNYSESGYLNYDSDTSTFVGRSFTSDSTLTITNPDGVSGQTQFSVNNSSSVQKVNVQLGDATISTQSTLSFSGGNNISVFVENDYADNRALISFAVGTSGTVTSIEAGIGLTASPNPIIDTGTISLADTGVTEGSYLNSNLTVNAQGQIIAISNGSISGGVTEISTSDSNIILTPNPIIESGTIALNTSPTFDTIYLNVNNLS